VIPGKQYTPDVLLHLAWRRKWLIVLPALTIAAIVGAVTYSLPNRYRSDTLILVVPQRVPEAYVRSSVTTRIEDRLQSISQQILSRTRLERIIQEFNLYADRRQTEIMEDIVERMRRDIQVEIVKGDAFSVSFTANEPRTAMRVTERLGTFFIDESLRDRELLAEGTNQFLESQLEDARRRLVENEKKLEEFRRQHDGELPTQLDANMQGLHNIEMQLQALLDSANRDRDQRLLLERLVADASVDNAPPQPAPTAGDDPATAAGPAAQLRAAEAGLQALLLRLKPEHPDVVRQKRVIEELQKRADAAAGSTPMSAPPRLSPQETARRNRLQEAKAAIANIDRQIADKTERERQLRGTLSEYQRRIEAAPTRQSELAELTRDYDTLQTMYKGLLAKKQESQISANLERRQIGEQFKILDPARLPEKPSSPNRPRLYLIGVFAAIAVGFLFAAGVEYFDRALRSEDDVRLAIGLPVLAAIPLMTRKHVPIWRRKFVAVTAAMVVLVGAAVAAWRLLQ
jgi:polysaccharide chain length determinant protein (PEP-CTERM system associated)